MSYKDPMIFISSDEDEPTKVLFSDFKELEKDNKRLKAVIDTQRGLLIVAQCPACDKSGAYYDNDGNICQCQWCYEVNTLCKSEKDNEKH